jgi:hypothetical protein
MKMKKLINTILLCILTLNFSHTLASVTPKLLKELTKTSFANIDQEITHNRTI